MTEPHRISISALEARTAASLIEAGAGKIAAQSVAHALVLAQADGMGGHGLIRLTTYAAQLRAGKVDGAAIPVVTQPFAATLRVDAARGFAYPALDLAVEHLTTAARQTGIAFAGVHRSGHCGAMGMFVERLARAGLIGLMFANAPAAMSAWGGRRPMFGTNPVACAFPYDINPVVIDLSLSKVARGQVIAAQKQKTQIPDDWALDVDGNPTTDPDAALAGTMLPVGGAKGAALAMMVEALAAGATGACFAMNASSFLDDVGPPPETGQMIIAMMPEAAGGSIKHLAALFDELAAEPGVRLPGARRFAARRASIENGIALNDSWFAV